jgi:hypothetical protein
MDDAVWNHAVFSKNRDRLLNSEVAQQFFAAVNKQAKRFMSDDHFTVDGTLIQAWASHKSFRAKDGSDDDGGDGANFHGTKRSNDTHESTTDPDARTSTHMIASIPLGPPPSIRTGPTTIRWPDASLPYAIRFGISRSPGRSVLIRLISL